MRRRPVAGDARTAADAGHRAGLLVEIGVGIDEGDQLAAAQHELVERVLGRLRQVARVDHQQDLDLRVDGFRCQQEIDVFCHDEAKKQLLLRRQNQ